MQLRLLFSALSRSLSYTLKLVNPQRKNTKGCVLLTFDDGCIIAISERTWFLERIRGSLMLVKPGTAHYDLSPDGFHLWATQYQKAGTWGAPNFSTTYNERLPATCLGCIASFS